MTRTGLDNHRNPVTASHRPSGEPRFALIDARMGDDSDNRHRSARAPRGVFNGISGMSGQESYRVSNWAMWSSGWASCSPTFTGSCTRVNVLGDVVAIEVSIRGTFLGPFETPAGVI